MMLAWNTLNLRAAMIEAPSCELLQGVVEMDETYVGGRPRKSGKRDSDKPSPHGRGTSKLPVIGVVQRGGKVIARPSKKVNANILTAFVSKHVDKDASLLVIDEYKGYRSMHKSLRHATIRHAMAYVDGIVHPNTIEGFGSLIRRAWYGAHHHYSKTFSNLYIAESCYKYNNRKHGNLFDEFIQSLVAA